jgi:hypothetical protein
MCVLKEFFNRFSSNTGEVKISKSEAILHLNNLVEQKQKIIEDTENTLNRMSSSFRYDIYYRNDLDYYLFHFPSGTKIPQLLSKIDKIHTELEATLRKAHEEIFELEKKIECMTKITPNGKLMKEIEELKQDKTNLIQQLNMQQRDYEKAVKQMCEKASD